MIYLKQSKKEIFNSIADIEIQLSIILGFLTPMVFIFYFMPPSPNSDSSIGEGLAIFIIMIGMVLTPLFLSLFVRIRFLIFDPRKIEKFERPL